MESSKQAVDTAVGLIESFRAEKLNVYVYESRPSMGAAAANVVAEEIRRLIESKGKAVGIFASAPSQNEFLAALVEAPNVDWSRVVGFHLDEYLAMPPTHPASFRKYLQERLIGPTGITMTHLLDGEQDPELVCRTAGQAISAAPIDVAFVGIGENSHLAFNDPPADFDTREPYIVVSLDEACRRQQFGEGWFPTLADVPSRAISMSVHQILEAHHILCIVPDLRKAEAVRASVEGPVTNKVPASILQTHPAVTLFLDKASASLLTKLPRDGAVLA